MGDLFKLKTSQSICDLETKALNSLDRADMAKKNGLFLVESMEREAAKRYYIEALKLACPASLDVIP